MPALSIRVIVRSAHSALERKLVTRALKKAAGNKTESLGQAFLKGAVPALSIHVIVRSAGVPPVSVRVIVRSAHSAPERKLHKPRSL